MREQPRRGGVVLDDQHQWLLPIFGDSRHLDGGGLWEHASWQVDPEGGALSFHALDPDAAVMELDHAPAEGQAQTSPRLAAVVA